MGWFINESLFLTVLETEKFKIKLLIDAVSGEHPLSDSQMRPLWGGVLWPLYGGRKSESSLGSLLYKSTIPFYEDSTLHL